MDRFKLVNHRRGVAAACGILVAKADEALYRAKRAGRATFHVPTF
jgi:PleD family two-component response regulator